MTAPLSPTTPNQARKARPKVPSPSAPLARAMSMPSRKFDAEETTGSANVAATRSTA
ncbi:MAG: hypothetical protein L0H64_12715 [Pseudonocardia sp.]|nr:hypothetical protein [Pseudonocardia sp.]